MTPIYNRNTKKRLVWGIKVKSFNNKMDNTEFESVVCAL